MAYPCGFFLAKDYMIDTMYPHAPSVSFEWRIDLAVIFRNLE